MTSASGPQHPARVGTAQAEALAALLAAQPLGSVLAMLECEGEEARIVGGAVRNTLMGVCVADFDIATTCLPHEITRRALAAGFKAVPTGMAHGTVTVIAQGQAFEVTTLREDIQTDGRYATVRFGRDFAGDARRRDFTMNALMLSADGVLHDHVGGLVDLEAGRIRFIGDAKARITEDYLRILRFFRFHASYGVGQLDAAGLEACVAGAAGLDGLSAERIRSETMKLLMARGAVAAFHAMSDIGLWQRVTGGIAMPKRLAQMVGLMPHACAAERLAAAAVLTTDDAHRFRLRLKLSNAEHEVLLSAAKAFEAVHGLALPDDRMLRKMSHQLGHASFALAVACEYPFLEQTEYSKWIETAKTPDFPLSGRDAVAAGVPVGPAIGKVLSHAERQWCEADFPMGQAALNAVLVGAVKACVG